jgi:DNA-binding MarR family transcriptional regulator
MPLRLIPHVHRATHGIGLQIAGIDGLDLDQAEAHVLAHLATSGGCTVGDVHRAFGHKRSTLTSILDRLERKQWIVRESHAADRRTFLIALTRNGTAVARRVTEHLERFEREALRGVDADQVHALRQILDRFAAGSQS